MEASTSGRIAPGRREVDLPARSGTGLSPRLLWGVTLAAVLVQITYPLLGGTALRAATAAAVLLFAAASLLHAAAGHGAVIAARVALVTITVALAAEAIGLRTGIPFGHYTYGHTLGPQLLGVPLLVLPAWTMMAYPSLVMARRLADALPGGRDPGGSGGGPGALPGRAGRPPGRRARVAVLGALALTGWDLFLDPQMVAAGHWTWTHPQPALPGVPEVPLTDYAGWLAVGVVLLALLDAVLPDPLRRGTDQPGTDPHGADPDSTVPPGPGVPALLLGWTWLGSTLAALTFADRPAVAGYTFVGLGVTVGPYLLLVRRDLAARRHDPARPPDRTRRPDPTHRPDPADPTRRPVRPGATALSPGARR